MIKTYIISTDVINQVLEALSNNMFSSDGMDDYNNDDIIEAKDALESEVNNQNKEQSIK